MKLISLLLGVTLYLVICTVLWILIDDPWTRVGTIASIIGTAISVITLVLVAFIKRELLAKSRLPVLQSRMRILNADLAASLRSFDVDPATVRQTLSALMGVLVAIDGKVSGEHQRMVRNTKKKILAVQRERTWLSKPVVLTEEKARDIYISLLSVEEAMKHLVSDLRRL